MGRVYYIIPMSQTFLTGLPKDPMWDPMRFNLSLRFLDFCSGRFLTKLGEKRNYGGNNFKTFMFYY